MWARADSSFQEHGFFRTYTSICVPIDYCDRDHPLPLFLNVDYSDFDSIERFMLYFFHLCKEEEATGVMGQLEDVADQAIAATTVVIDAAIE